MNDNIGQHLILGVRGTTLSDKGKAVLKKIQPGGIILFESNVKSKSQLKKLIKDIKEIINIPPFITIDQEGGQVDRLRTITTSIPSMWGLSKIGLPELLLAQKKLIKDLIEFDFNMNLAPVLDINSNPQNPIIGTRSIGNDAITVSNYGIETAKLFLEHNIIPVVKHFPGHGDLTIDSHFSLPVLEKSKKDLENFELIPFINAIKNKLPSIMIGHIQVPALEKNKNKPASISKNIIKNLLRDEMGFNGLVVTDDITMKGITNHYTPKDATKEAISAGADQVILASAEYITDDSYENFTLDVFEGLKDKYNASEAFQIISSQSLKRIDRIKKKYLHPSTKKTISVTEAQLYNIASKVVHFSKKDLFFTPFNSKPLEVIYPITPKLIKEDLEKVLAEVGLNKADTLNYPINPSKTDISEIVKSTIKYDRRILITYDVAHRKKQKNLTEALLKVDPGLLVISVGLDYDLELIPEIKNYVAAYAPNYISLLAAFKKIT